MVAPAPAPRRSVARVLPPHPVLAALVMLAFTALLYVIELVDQLTGESLDSEGIVSRSVSGLGGIIWAPLLHGGWPHLLANTVPFLVFGFLAMAGGMAQWLMVTATIWLLSGVGVWLAGPSNTSTIGASGLIFGWLVFLLVRGFFARSLGRSRSPSSCSRSGAACCSVCSRARRRSRGRGTCSGRWPGCCAGRSWPRRTAPRCAA